jgi:hypothetical protein
MILEIPKEMKRVDPKTFRWFIRSLPNPQVIDYSNGVGYFQDSTMVAAKTSNEQHFIRVKSRR